MAPKDRIEKIVRVSRIPDENGRVGMECPNSECRGYFKVKPGTGLKITEMHCPYCGHKGTSRDFVTTDQQKYAMSVGNREIHKLIQGFIKDSVKDIQASVQDNDFISVSVDYRPRSLPSLEYYREKDLETDILCQNCSLEYAIYGVFAFCPDCGQSNSVQLFEANIDLIQRLLGSIEGIGQDGYDLLLESCLGKCVDRFDGFGRELCRIHLSKAINDKEASKISLQNIEKARERFGAAFGIDIASSISDDEWKFAIICFQKRHCYTHSMGVIDEDYVRRSGDPSAVLGRKVSITADEISRLCSILKRLALSMTDSLNAVTTS